MRPDEQPVEQGLPSIEIKETGVSLGRRIAYGQQCRQRTAIFLLQLWNGCQVYVKICSYLGFFGGRLNK